jgi:hypothetical protein
MNNARKKRGQETGQEGRMKGIHTQTGVPMYIVPVCLDSFSPYYIMAHLISF